LNNIKNLKATGTPVAFSFRQKSLSINSIPAGFFTQTPQRLSSAKFGFPFASWLVPFATVG
jgi:hypothetical protein